MMDENTAVDSTIPNGSAVATWLVRLVVPAYVMVGAAMKYLTGRPDSLPGWMYNWLLDNVPAEIPPEEFVLTALRSTIAIEVAAVGLMLFVPRLARVTAGAILAVFLFVLIAEITYLGRSAGLMAAAFSGGCGCFGSASLPPGYMVLIDGLLLAGVIGLKPRAVSLGDTPKWSVVVAMLWLVIGVPMALNMDYNIPPDESWKLDRPTLWVGMHVDDTKLAEFVEDDWGFFGSGRQTWVFYRESCPTCHNLFETEYGGELGDRVVVAVQMETDETVTMFEAKPIVCPDCQWTRLRDGVQWYINSPTTIEIGEDGIILEVIDHQLAPHEEGAELDLG